MPVGLACVLTTVIILTILTSARQTKSNEAKSVDLPVNIGGKLCGYHPALALMRQHTLHQPLLHRRLTGGSAGGQHIG